MRHYRCYLCGADAPVELDTQTWRDSYLSLLDESLNAEVRKLVTCGACGFVQRDPKLTPEELEALYQKFRDHSMATEPPDQYFDRITSLPPEQSENFAKLEWLEPRLRAHFDGAPPKNVLDIGCGGGVLLHAFAKRFPETAIAGVEPTPAFAELAARRLNAKIVEGMFQRGTFEECFDAIFAVQVLEHVADPVDFLRAVRGNLSPNGIVYLEVPDVADLGLLPPDHDRFMSQHLHIFSAASLTEVCRRAGLQVIDITAAVTLRHKHNLNALARIAEVPEGAWRESAAKVVALRDRGFRPTAARGG